MSEKDSKRGVSRSLFCRMLSSVTEVHPTEVKTAALMTLAIFLILASYLTAKVVREPLILSGGGAELKSYASAFQVAILFVVVRLYTKCVCSFNRRKLINQVVIFFAACLVVFWAILVTYGSINGILYYLWTGIFSLVVIAQFWSFANDIYTPEQGKRLFVLLAFGASAGGVFGPMVVSLILELVGLYNLLLVSAVLLIASLAIMNYIEARVCIDESHCKVTAGQESDEAVVSHKGALSVLYRSKYLLMIGLLVLVSNWVNTTGEYILGRSVGETAKQMFAGVENSNALQQDFIGQFYADFYSVVGFLGLIVQLFLVSRIVKYMGIRFALMVLPVIALGGYATMALIPVLGAIRWSKTAENSTDYSLNSTVRQILFLPTTREEKYKAKIAIDTLFVRGGDLLSAGLVFVGAGLFSFSIREFALFSTVLVVIWIGLAYFIGRENQKLMNALPAKTRS